MRRGPAMMTITLIVLGALTSGCTSGSRPARCASAAEGPATVLALDVGATHRYVFLPNQQFVVVSDPGSAAARSSSTNVTAVTSSGVLAGKRYTRFVTQRPGEATVSADSTGTALSAQVAVVCNPK